MKANWTARCKSGYQFEREVTGWFGRRKRVWKECRRFASRGEILCGDCATAVVVEPVSEPVAVLRPMEVTA